MKKYEKIYHKLRKEYTDEEIAEDFLIPEDLTEEEERQIQATFGEFRMKLWREQSDEDRLLGKLLGLKYRMRSYIKNEKFDAEKTLVHFFKEYLTITNRKEAEIAEDINVSTDKIKVILLGQEKPNKAFFFRLEKHSGDTIPALYWWKLSQKEVEYEILTAKEMKQKERMEVKKVVFQKPRKIAA